ncbi:DUF1847 domain-containing protein [bacterium]|nr:DUF1847 domain-containing protein [bacterium]
MYEAGYSWCRRDGAFPSCSMPARRREEGAPCPARAKFTQHKPVATVATICRIATVLRRRKGSTRSLQMEKGVDRQAVPGHRAQRVARPDTILHACDTIHTSDAGLQRSFPSRHIACMKTGQSARSIMRFAIPLFGERVAPRCTAAGELLIGTIEEGRITSRRTEPCELLDSITLIAAVRDQEIDTLICGGISKEMRDALGPCEVEVIPNVTGTAEDVLHGLLRGDIRPDVDVSMLKARRRMRQNGVSTKAEMDRSEHTDEKAQADGIDCLACDDPICRRGGECPQLPAEPGVETDRLSNETADDTGPQRTFTRENVERAMLDVAHDIHLEEERRLCRLSELVYFCLEMGYKRIGVAFCHELQGPADILTNVLRRFFTVHPVCCMASRVTDQRRAADGNGASMCRPQKQAQLLNQCRTDLNVIVGLCIGADCVFTAHSRAPVSTLFVKDKALAHNPVGAIYSEQYLNEASHPVHLSALPSDVRERVGDTSSFHGGVS